MATLTIGTLVLHGDAAGLSQFYLDQDGLTGWEDISDSKAEIRERPMVEGAFYPSSDPRSSLPISATCWYYGVDRLDANAAKRLLRSQVGKGRLLTATFVDTDGTFRRTVSIRDVTIPPSGSNPIFEFTIYMVAPDPLMYGPDQAFTAGVPSSGGGLTFPLGTDPSGDYWAWGADGSSGRVSFTNAGSAPTWPMLAVSGGLTGGFVLTDVTAGRSVQFERAIPSGSKVTINQRTGRAYIDTPTNDVSSGLTILDFFAVGPGETHQVQFSPLGVVSGTPRFTLTAAPAYR